MQLMQENLSVVVKVSYKEHSLTTHSDSFNKTSGSPEDLLQFFRNVVQKVAQDGNNSWQHSNILKINLIPPIHMS